RDGPRQGGRAGQLQARLLRPAGRVHEHVGVRGAGEAAGGEQRRGVHVFRQDAVDAVVVVEGGEVAGQERRREVGQFQVDGGELLVGGAVVARRQQVFFLPQHG